MLKKIVGTVLGLAILLGAIAGIKALQIEALLAQAAHYTPPPESVATAVVREAAWRPELSSVGSLSAVEGVTVSPELDGKIAAIAFRSGSSVRAGDLLVRQDTSVEEAQLRAAEAAADLARINLKRSRELFAKLAISQSQLDSDTAQYEQAVAQADDIRATIAKKTIRAPFSGRLGVRQVDLGQILKAGDPIVSLQSLDPIFVDFYLPQQDVALLSPGLTVRLSGDAVGGRPVEGKITAINPDVDPATRNIRVQATVENPDGRLRPGMFVDVTTELPHLDRVLVIPATAVLAQPYGSTVYVVEDAPAGRPGPIVRQQIVHLGEQRGDFISVLDGLKAGETVVSVGAFKLRPGATVKVENAFAPDAQLSPHPSDS